MKNLAIVIFFSIFLNFLALGQKVGIGTNEPKSKLEIRADASFADELLLLLRGSDTLFVVQNDGKVGIGTSDPQQLLHLKGTQLNIVLENTALNGVAYNLNSTNSGNFRLIADNANIAIDIDKDGRIGLGALTGTYTSSGSSAKVILSDKTYFEGDIKTLGSVFNNGIMKVSGSGDLFSNPLVASEIPNLDASKITSGFFNNARISQASVTQHQGALSIGWGQLTSVPATFPSSAHTHAAGDITSGVFAVARIPNLDASKITTGILPVARGGTGAGSFASGKILFGNNTNPLNTNNNLHWDNGNSRIGIGIANPQAPIHVNTSNVNNSQPGDPAGGLMWVGGKNNDESNQFINFRNPSVNDGGVTGMSWWSADVIFGRFRNEAFWSFKETHGGGLGSSVKDIIRATINDAGGFQNLGKIVIAPDNAASFGQVGIGVLNPTYKLELVNNTTNGIGRGRANSWNTYSDGRIKSNRKDLEYGLSEIMKIKPYYYFQHNSTKDDENQIIINEDGEFTFGIVAQELYKIIPEMVYKPNDENVDLWSVDYDKFGPILIKAIQEQQQQIEVLKTKNKELELLKAELEEIKNYLLIEAKK